MATAAYTPDSFIGEQVDYLLARLADCDSETHVRRFRLHTVAQRAALPAAIRAEIEAAADLRAAQVAGRA